MFTKRLLIPATLSSSAADSAGFALDSDGVEDEAWMGRRNPLKWVPAQRVAVAPCAFSLSSNIPEAEAVDPIS